jgi:hypothetical protein
VHGDLGEMKIPWLIALMVLCCDPLAIALASRGFGTAVIRAGIFTLYWWNARRIGIRAAR